MKHWIGIDVGGTDIKFAVINHEADIVVHGMAKTPQGSDPDRIPHEMKRIINGLLESFDHVEAVGVSTAGVVDSGSGEIIFAGPTIPAYQGTNLKKTIEDAFGIGVTVINDVNAAALGEMWRGAARNSGNFCCITIGTGVGGALICNRQLVAGSHHRAGEIGHFLYDRTTGTTYEDRASMTALMNKASKELASFTGTGHDLFAMAKAGNRACDDIIDGWAEEVARGLAEMICLADPELIVIGGGVSEQKEFLLDKLRRHTAAYLPANFSKTELKAAELGNKAALYGAVYPYFAKRDGVNIQ